MRTSSEPQPNSLSNHFVFRVSDFEFLSTSAESRKTRWIPGQAENDKKGKQKKQRQKGAELLS